MEVGLLIAIGSTLLLLAEEAEWLVYVKLALWLIVFRGLAEFVHKFL